MALADVMNSFSLGMGKTAQEQQAPQQTVPGNIPPNAQINNQGSAQTAANGVIPNGSNAETTESIPLDEFKGIWDTDGTKTDEPQFGLLGEINPQKIMEAAGKVNFAKVISKEDIAAIQAGGEDAVNALGRALNATSQTVYAQSAIATSKLIEQATTKLEEKFLSQLPDHIKRQSLSDTMKDENPAYSHPAAAPIVKMIESQIATKYPTATVQELKKLSQDYFTRTFSAISGEDKKQADKANANTGTDWEKEFDLI